MDTNIELESTLYDDCITLPQFKTKYMQIHEKNDSLSLHCDFIVEITDISYKELKAVFNSKTEQNVALKISKSLTGTLQEGLLCFYNEGKFCDATLNSNGSTFPVHRNVLSARSPVFCAMFDSATQEGQTGVVNTPDLDPDTLEQLLLFVYTDSLEGLQRDAASKLYYAADKYGIRLLKEKCLSVLVAGLSVSNVCEALVLADTHQDRDLFEAAQDFIGEHDEVMDSMEWKDLEENKSKLTVKVFRELFLTRGKK